MEVFIYNAPSLIIVLGTSYELDEYLFLGDFVLFLASTAADIISNVIE